MHWGWGGSLRASTAFYEQSMVCTGRQSARVHLGLCVFLSPIKSPCDLAQAPPPSLLGAQSEQGLGSTAAPAWLPQAPPRFPGGSEPQGPHEVPGQSCSPPSFLLHELHLGLGFGGRAWAALPVPLIGVPRGQTVPAGLLRLGLGSSVLRTTTPIAIRKTKLRLKDKAVPEFIF